MLANQSNVLLRSVGVNPTRMGLISVLHEMGASVGLLKQDHAGPEPVADMQLHAQPIKGILINDGKTYNFGYLIDELPLVALLGAVAEGVTTVIGAAEISKNALCHIGPL